MPGITLGWSGKRESYPFDALYPVRANTNKFVILFFSLFILNIQHFIKA